MKVSNQKETVDTVRDTVNEKSISQALNDKSTQRVTDASPIIIDETESGTSEKKTLSYLRLEADQVPRL